MGDQTAESHPVDEKTIENPDAYLAEMVWTLDRALLQCATAATIHRLSNKRAILVGLWGCYGDRPTPGLREEVELAIDAARDALRWAVRPSPQAK